VGLHCASQPCSWPSPRPRRVALREKGITSAMRHRSNTALFSVTPHECMPLVTHTSANAWSHKSQRHACGDRAKQLRSALTAALPSPIRRLFRKTRSPFDSAAVQHSPLCSNLVRSNSVDRQVFDVALRCVALRSSAICPCRSQHPLHALNSPNCSTANDGMDVRKQCVHLLNVLDMHSHKLFVVRHCHTRVSGNSLVLSTDITAIQSR
jgi:hypothetical protein